MITAEAPAWYRVAALTPRLRNDLKLVRQRERGRDWFVLRSPFGGAACRLNEPAYAIAARLDGGRTVESVWEELQASHAADGSSAEADEPVRQDEVITLLATLQAHGLLEAGSMPGGARAAPDGTAGQRAAFNPLSWRMRLLDPARLLDGLAPVGAVLFSRWATVPWVLVLAGLLLGSAWHLEAILAHGARWLQTPGYVFWALAWYWPLKLLHELAHGLALRRHGVAVREAGIQWVFGLPLPYVDASGAALLAHKGPRMVVSAAGILAELAVAALALVVWLVAPQDSVRAAAFVALCTAGFSTLVFNANPLQRFDGYHLMCDALELHNLAPRSRAWWGRRLRRLFGGSPGETVPPHDAVERAALELYAPASLAWQVVASVALVFWIGGWSSWLGALVALLLLGTAIRAVGVPAWGAWRRGGSTLRRTRWIGAAVAVLVLAAAVVPAPRHVVAEGVVWIPEDAQVRADAEGVVIQVHVREGEVVRPGEVILTLGSTRLDMELARHAATVKSLEHALFQALGNDPVQARAVEHQLVTARAALDRAEERAAALVLRAGVQGRLVLPNSADLEGRYVRQGELLGHVITSAATRVRAALAAEDAALLPPGGPRDVRALLNDDPGGTAHPGLLARDGRGAQARLPSAALATDHGGSWVTDPADPTHLRPLAPVVWVDVELPGVHGARLGARAWTRFELEPAPLLSQALARLRGQVLRRFSAGE